MGGVGVRPSRASFSVIACFLLLLTASGNAQVTQSTILGAVQDPTGAAVVGASITVNNQATNIDRTVTTNESGDYRVAGLAPGRYSVKISARGFQTTTISDVVVVASQIRRVDASLRVGDLATVVEVKGGATSQIETEAVTLSNTKNSIEFQQLPMSALGRSFFNITAVTAGVQGNLINGGRGTANNITIDGLAVNDPISSVQTANGMIAGPEELQEIKVQTANSSAEYPQVAQFIGVSKSGSNQLHGSMYWGNYNTKTAARGFFDSTGPSYTIYNMFAFANGGPVYLPKLYDGRNRTFYFFSYGGGRYRTGNRMRLNVPTAAFKQGDFSGLAGRINILDPTSRTPFAENKIPASRISGMSKAVQDMIYPDPNYAGSGTYGLVGNLYADPGGKFDSDNLTIRVDHKISDRNNLFVRGGLTINNKDTYGGGLKSGFGSSSYYGNHPGRTLAISDTHTFTPTVVNEFKLGYARDLAGYFDYNYGVDVVSKIGLQGIDNPNNDPVLYGMPAFSIGGAESFASTSTTGLSRQGSNTYQVTDNLSWFRGRHNFKFGADVRRFQVNDASQSQSVRGSFSFDDQLSGFGYANFLLGLPSSASRVIARPNAYVRSTMFGFYVQDEFKLNNRMTLNYGVRYEYQTPWVEKFDRFFTFVPARASLATAGSAIPKDMVPAVAAKLSIITAASAGLPLRSLSNSDANNFSPRVGLAIRPFGDATTVVRLGYGIYTQMLPGLHGMRNTGGPWQSTEAFYILNNEPTIKFPTPFTTTGNFSGLQNIVAANADFPNERTQQWNISIGREFWGTAIDVSYVGTQGKNLPFTEDLNLLRPSTTPYNVNRVAFPQFSYISLVQAGASSIYHGLNFQADRKVRGGINFNVNYTWCKALTDVSLGSYTNSSSQNQYARYLERADDSGLRRQQLRFSYIWELPFGRNRHFLNKVSRPVNLIVGGWQVSGITTMTTGARLNPGFSGNDATNTNQFGGRPDRIGNGNFDADLMQDTIRRRAAIFDRSAFSIPASGRGFYGNSARYVLTGPGTVNWNMIAAKGFYINEQVRVQLRAEFFNAFNHANFSNPSTNVSSSSYGLVTGASSGRRVLFGLRIDY